MVFNAGPLWPTIALEFFARTVLLARVNDLVSDKHFSVDGDLLEAWASHKSLRPKDGNGNGNDGGRDFHGDKRNNTHAATTDPDTRLARKGKGKEAKLSCLTNTLMQNRHGLIVGVDTRHASGMDEREAALDLVDAHLMRGHTLGADKGTPDISSSPHSNSGASSRLSQAAMATR